MGRLDLKNGSRTQRDGAKGELLTLWYLRFRGYHLLERNYMVGHKEIDLIMRRRNTVAFIEVKTRRVINPKFPPRTTVDADKRRNIIAAAKTYALRKGLTKVVLRFDISEVELSSWHINYIANAYTD